MDFFAHQESARRRTGLLIFLFVTAVLLTILVVYAGLAAILPGFIHEGSRESANAWNARLFAMVAVALTLLIGAGSAAKIASLSGGGESVAKMIGARRVANRSVDPLERTYLNLVEEMALASGIPPPGAYVMDGESGINAFAAGTTPGSAVVCVTAGALERLSRDELQGVIAHEFSHIFNGDMRLNIRIVGVLHGLLMIALAGRLLLSGLRGGRRTSSRDRGSGVVLVLALGLLFLVVGSIGVFFGRLIQAAVSRQREFLADAAAVQFTRNPRGLAAALRKIALPGAGSAVLRSGSEEMSHFFFANGMAGGLFDLFTTHPPLMERIRRLDASLAAELEAMPVPEEPIELDWETPVAPPRLPATPAEALRSAVGAPWMAHLDAASRRIGTLPEAVREAARDSTGAQALICALLFDRERPEIRDAQRLRLDAAAGNEFAAAASSLAGTLDAVPEGMRHSVLVLALPALRTLSAGDFTLFLADVDALILADESTTLFEYTVSRILRRMGDPAGVRRVGTVSASGLAGELSCLFSALAHAGQADPVDAAQAFELAKGHAPREVHLALSPPSLCDPARVGASLQAVERLVPSAQRWVLDAAIACLSRDGRVEPREADLFRALATAMDCPAPLALGD